MSVVSDTEVEVVEEDTQVPIPSKKAGLPSWNLSCKRRKPNDMASEMTTDRVTSIHNTDLVNFGDFMFKRIVTENSQKKTVVVEGVFRDVDGVALVLLEKAPFTKKSLKEGYLTAKSTLCREFRNDVYGNYVCHPMLTARNSVKTTVIHPATEEHIKKFEPQILHLVRETYDLYQTITLPYLEKTSLDCQWVINILDHKKEADRILFENEDPDTGFILVPDMKWDSREVDNLYMVAIAHKRGIKSLRDLTAEHLPLLKNIYEEGIAAIEKKYNLPGSQMRIFVHYQPSYYHLHVHFTNLSFDAPGINTEKSHLLSSVIDNIELQGDHYQKATLSFIVKEGYGLFKVFEEAGVVQKAPKKECKPLVIGEVVQID